MKSKRAGEYLKEHLGTFPLEAYVGAMKSVELAEEDMIEKAVKAFAEACEMYAGNERCLECVKCRDCARVKKFRQRLEKL